MISDELKDILDNDDSGLFDTSERPTSQTPIERMINSFLEINDFVNEYGRVPHGGTNDVTERRLFSRLKGFMSDPEKADKVKDFDEHGLLETPIKSPATLEEVLANDELGIFDDDTGILTLKNVPRKVDTPDYIGRQKPAKDFRLFEPNFLKCHEDIKSGKRVLKRFAIEKQIEKGQFFILKGVMVYVAEIGQQERANSKTKARLRLIYENGTESDILNRSLARALYRDGQRITVPDDKLMAPFENIDDEDESSGYIYVLSSLSDKPEITTVHNLHKIGFSTTPVEQRLRHAAEDPTFLMAPVRIEATYRCFNLSPHKFEGLVHRFFAQARLDVQIAALKSEKYNPAEWFIVPMEVIDETINLIINGEIIHYYYDKDSEELKLVQDRVV
jgi:hypothetical protein